MPATECTDCDSTEVAWFIRDKPYCEGCANARYEIQDHPFEDDG